MIICWNPSRKLEDIEQEVILYAYKFFQQNKTQTAHSLGIAVRTLDAKLEKYAERSSQRILVDPLVAGQSKAEIERITTQSQPRNDPAAGMAVEQNDASQQSVPVRERQEVQKVSRGQDPKGSANKRMAGASEARG